MKKLLSLLIVCLLLVACSKENEEETIKIVCPTGAPALAFISEIDNDSFESNAVPNNIISLMNEASDKDVIVIDTINGIKAIENGAPFKIAATITFGNFYLASTGNDEDATLNKGDRICLFLKGGAPDLLFHFLFGNEYDETIEYVNAASDAGKVLALGKNLESGNDIDYVMIAEPALSAVLNNTEAKTYGKAEVYLDMQEKYQELTGYKMCQASVFVKDGKDYHEFLNNLEENINTLLSDKTYIDSYLANYDDNEISSIYGIGKGMIIKSLSANSINLGYKMAIKIKPAIDTYRKMFNLGNTNEEIYYQ